VCPRIQRQPMINVFYCWDKRKWQGSQRYNGVRSCILVVEGLD
jgi:hypothetical protein